MAGRVPDMYRQPLFDLAVVRAAVTNLDLDRHHEFCHDFSAMRVNGGCVQPVPGFSVTNSLTSSSPCAAAMPMAAASRCRQASALLPRFKCRDHFTLYLMRSDMRQEK